MDQEKLVKVRNGFVSNSSSSSFVTIGRWSSEKDIDKPNVMIYGGRGNEGIEYFRPSKDMIEYIKENDCKDVEFFEEVASFGESSRIDKFVLIYNLLKFEAKEIMILTFDIDYNPPQTLEDFIISYGSEKDKIHKGR